MTQNTLLSWSLVVALGCAAGPALAQSFYDGFEQPISDTFADASTDWDAVGTDPWTTARNAATDRSLGVCPVADDESAGSFGGTADSFENMIVTGDVGWRDYGVQTTFRTADNDALGVGLRYSGRDNYYLLVLSRDLMPAVDGAVEDLTTAEARLYRIAGGVAALLVSAPRAYVATPETNQWLRIEAVGTQLRAWIGTGAPPAPSGEPPEATALLEANDTDVTAPAAGRSGLYGFALGNGAVGTYFDAFRVLRIDSDHDALSNDYERTIGTDPFDGDSDDDGVADGAEYFPAEDADGDGLINALDPDSDNDGLPDGLEFGVTAASPDTNLAAGHFVPDADPATTTDPTKKDSDGGGVADGAEDKNHNGKHDPALGESDPSIPSDDQLETDTGDTASDSTADTGRDTETVGDTGPGDAGNGTAGADSESDSTAADYGRLAGGYACSCQVPGAVPVGLFGSVVRIFLILLSISVSCTLLRRKRR